MKVAILDLAANDLIEGYGFYERQQPGIGRYFVSSLYSDIESLGVYGGIHPKVYGKYYRALSKRFPFAIFYTIKEDVVRIHAVVDCRRSPSWIRSHLT